MSKHQRFNNDDSAIWLHSGLELSIGNRKSIALFSTFFIEYRFVSTF